MRRKTTVIIIAVVGLLLALGSIWLRIRPVVPMIDPALATGIGEALAAETIKAVNDQGAVVAVLYGDPSQPGGSTDPRFVAFQAALTKHKAIQLAAPEAVLPDPNENNGLPGCPPSAFQAILQHHANAGAIVFFMEIPDWSLINASFPQSKAPRLITLVSGGAQARQRYGGYFTSGHLAAFIIPRHELAAGSTPPKTPRECFDFYYRIVTPQNFESLPD